MALQQPGQHLPIGKEEVEVTPIEVKIQVATMRVQQDIFSLNMNASDTVKKVKEKIQEMKGIPTSQQKVKTHMGDTICGSPFGKSTVLQDSTTLEEYDGVLLYLDAATMVQTGGIFDREISHSFLISISGGTRDFIIEAHKSQTIELVKAKIQEQEGIPASKVNIQPSWSCIWWGDAYDTWTLGRLGVAGHCRMGLKMKEDTDGDASAKREPESLLCTLKAAESSTFGTLLLAAATAVCDDDDGEGRRGRDEEDKAQRRGMSNPTCWALCQQQDRASRRSWV